MLKHWVKCPQPGQFRGEGVWVSLEDNPQIGLDIDMNWDAFVKSNFLPTYVGETPPE